MFRPHKHQNKIWIACGAAIVITTVALILESYGVERLIVLFWLLILGLIVALVLGVVIIVKHFRNKRDIKNHNFNDYYKNLNRRRK